jgi:hypothetical protein
MRTLPSLQALSKALGCEPHVEPEHPELGVLKYRVWYETELERIELTVLPIAEEVSLGLITKNPTRIVRLALQDVSEIELKDDEGKTCIAINFRTKELQSLWLSLGPPVSLYWGNFQEPLDRNPAWEQD